MAGRAVPEIVIDGTLYGPISLLTLDQPWNGHHSFSLMCPFRERLDSLMDISRKFVGKPITIQLTAGLRSGEGQLTFSGFISNVKLSKHEGSVMQLILQGFSPTRLMDDGPHNQTFTDQSLEDIAKSLTDTFGSPETSSDIRFTETLPYVTQYKESAYRFLGRILATYGEWFYYDGERLVMGTPPDDDQLELVFGRDMSALEVSADAVPANFKLQGYDYVGDEHYDATSAGASVRELDDLTKLILETSGDLYSYEPSFAQPFCTAGQTELDHHALRRRAGQSAELINLFGESSRLDLRLGQTVRVKALASTLGEKDLSEAADYGSFRILHLTHHCDGLGNYHNSLQGIPAKLQMPPVTDARITPPHAETQPAEVTDNKDPEQLGRVKVQFPWQKTMDEHTPWVRVAAAGAGGGHGAYFVPEAGDQVMIGFEFNNPDRPIVLGSVYHGKVKPPNAADPDNNSKIIRTRSGNQVVLSDKGGEESIKIESGTNVITLSLKGDTSIDITSTGDLNFNGRNITIKATENFTVTAGQNADISAKNASTLSAKKGITIDGQKEVNVTALNIDVAAKKALTAKGGATAEVAGANTTVKGDVMVTVSAPMVKLN